MIRAVSGAGRRARASCDRVMRWRKGSVEVTGADVQAPQAAETPRPSRPSPAPTLAAQLETGDPAAAHLSALSEVTGPLPLHVPKPRRQAASPLREARPASRQSSLSSRRLWGAHSSVVANSHDHAVDLAVETVAKRRREADGSDCCSELIHRSAGVTAGACWRPRLRGCLLAHVSESQGALAGRRGSGRQQAHWRLPQSRQSRSADRSLTTPGERRRGRLRNWRRAGPPAVGRQTPALS
jgi:hypothetical protein